MLKVLSLGAGVQSSTVLLMSCRGELPKLDAAIFADTGWEPIEVYDHLLWLTNEASKAGIPVYKVGRGTIRSDALTAQVAGDRVGDVRWGSMPMFVSGDTTGKINRQCTMEYKIQPLEKFMKQVLLGVYPPQRMPKYQAVEQWFGISVDEVQRMRTAPEKWRRFVYPLCGVPDDMLPKRYSRIDCLDWLAKNYPDRTVPRSACLGCPYHSNAEWRAIKANPEYWKDVTEFDRAIRNSGGMRGQVFLHRSLIPLEEVDFRTDEDKGQGNLFNNECQGMCGV